MAVNPENNGLLAKQAKNDDGLTERWREPETVRNGKKIDGTRSHLTVNNAHLVTKSWLQWLHG